MRAPLLTSGKSISNVVIARPSECSHCDPEPGSISHKIRRIGWKQRLRDQSPTPLFTKRARGVLVLVCGHSIIICVSYTLSRRRLARTRTATLRRPRRWLG